MKINSISKFENSLTEYLINTLADKHNDAKSYAYKYNNLKVYMDPKRIPEAHFFVQIGISEACFGIKDGTKLEGGLGNEDAYVKRWAERYNIHKELEAHWNIVMEAIAEEDDEFGQPSGGLKSAENALRRAEHSDEKLDVDMTSTGIDRQKREQYEDKKSRFVGLKKDLEKEVLNEVKRLYDNN